MNVQKEIIVRCEDSVNGGYCSSALINKMVNALYSENLSLNTLFVSQEDLDDLRKYKEVDGPDSEIVGQPTFSYIDKVVKPNRLGVVKITRLKRLNGTGMIIGIDTNDTSKIVIGEIYRK